MDQSLFVRQGETYVPTASAGGPWSPSHLHGGSPTGLLALLMEQATADSGLRLSRLTVDLLRPVPAAPLTAELAVVRAGRRLRVLQASLLADGVEVCRASGLFLEQAGAQVPDFGRFETGGLEPRGDRPVMTLAEVGGDGKGGGWTPRGLHTTARICVLDGVGGQGQGRVWMSLPVPVVAGQPCSPLVRAATLSDFGNGIAQLRLAPEVGSINSDLSLYLHRDPRGDWLGLDARARMQDNGTGLVDTTLYDEDGPVGRVLQATLAMPLYAGG